MKDYLKERVLTAVTVFIVSLFAVLAFIWVTGSTPKETEAKAVSGEHTEKATQSETKLTVEEADVLDARNGEGRWKEETPEVTPDHIDQEKIDDEISENFDLFCDVVFAEAGNQGDRGLRLVADVIINRMRCGEAFDDTLHEVLTAPNQFSCVSDGGAARWQGHTKDNVRKICQQELSNVTNKRVYYFRTGHYGYGKPLFKYKDHYFSGR